MNIPADNSYKCLSTKMVYIKYYFGNLKLNIIIKLDWLTDAMCVLMNILTKLSSCVQLCMYRWVCIFVP